MLLYYYIAIGKWQGDGAVQGLVCLYLVTENTKMEFASCKITHCYEAVS